MSELKPCPFCGNALEENRRRMNPYARCATPDCMGGKLPLISLDAPGDIERWNRRHTLDEADAYRQALSETGVCPDCLQESQHHMDEPFATCGCGTGEDYADRPMQRLQMLEALIKAWADLKGVPVDLAPRYEQLMHKGGE